MLKNWSWRKWLNLEEKFPELDADDNFILWLEHDNNSHWVNKDNNDDPVTKKNHQAAKKCHLALGYRFDSDGEASFIEAGLYCSFGDDSQISEMVKVRGIPLDLLVKMIVSLFVPLCIFFAQLMESSQTFENLCTFTNKTLITANRFGGKTFGCRNIRVNTDGSSRFTTQLLQITANLGKRLARMANKCFRCKRISERKVQWLRRKYL